MMKYLEMNIKSKATIAIGVPYYADIADLLHQ